MDRKCIRFEIWYISEGCLWDFFRYILVSLMSLLSSSSVLFCIQSTVICLEQLFFYPWVVEKLQVPIPYLAAVGQALEVVFYFLMVCVPNVWFSMIAATLLWVSYSMSTPAPISIISVRIEIVLVNIDNKC